MGHNSILIAAMLASSAAVMVNAEETTNPNINTQEVQDKKHDVFPYFIEVQAPQLNGAAFGGLPIRLHQLGVINGQLALPLKFKHKQDVLRNEL